MAEHILAVLLSFTAPWYAPGRNPETPEQYRQRLTFMAEAIEEESLAADWPDHPLEDLVALVLVVWHEESGLALDVHNGRRTNAGGRAVCLGQIMRHRLVPRAEWRQLTGADAAGTRRCAAATTRLLTYHARNCVRRRGPLSPYRAASIMAAYGAGDCRAPTSRLLYRGRRWARVRKQLDSLQQ
jgi:hypothetical protein